MAQTDLSQQLQADIQELRGNELIESKAVDLAVGVLSRLVDKAATTARVGPSVDGCSIAWPRLGVFCEVDSDAIEVQLFPVAGGRTGVQIEKYTHVVDAATKLNDVINA